MNSISQSPAASSLARLRRSTIVVGFLILTTLLAACTAPAQPAGAAEPPAAAEAGATAAVSAAPGAPVVGGELVIGSPQEPDSLNPWLTGLTVGLEVESMIYDSLTRVDTSGAHVPALAAEVPSLENGGISQDLRTYTYKLRDNVTWHDGTPFTAGDVVFTYEAIANPEVNARSRTGFELIESAEALDDHTVRFTLNQPNAAFLETWAYRGILPKHIFASEDLNNSEYNRAPTVGTGPYKFVEWVSGDRIVVERNENYYRDGGYIDRIVYQIVPSSDTLLTLLETGEIDARFAIPAEQVELVKGLGSYNVLATPAHAYFHFTINNADPILGDKAVRQALTHGLDKQVIADTVLQGLVQPHGSPVAQPSWVYVDHNDRYPFDPAAAAALLDGAGWAPGEDGIRVKDGQRLSLTLLNIAGESERLQVTQLAQAMWKEIGVEVNISQVDAPTFVDAMTKQNYQFAYGWWGFSVDPSGYNDRWLSTSAGHWLNYDNPAVDQLLLDALQTADPAARKALYAQFQDTVVEDATNIYVYNRVNFDAVKPRLQGFAPSASSATNMWNVHEWWLQD